MPKVRVTTAGEESCSKDNRIGNHIYQPGETVTVVMTATEFSELRAFAAAPFGSAIKSVELVPEDDVDTDQADADAKPDQLPPKLPK